MSTSDLDDPKPPPGFMPEDKPDYDPPVSRRSRSDGTYMMAEGSSNSDDEDVSFTAYCLTKGKKKTFKREVAFLGLVFWGFLTIRIFWYLDPEYIRALDAAYSVATMALWSFAAAAYSLDVFVRMNRGR